MNCAALQSRCETLDAGVFSPEDDVANRGVIREHADDDLAVEEVGEFHCGSEAEPDQRAHLIRSADISGDAIRRVGEVRRHRGPHVTKTDKPDFA
jgi:hypothetical protein